MAERKPFLLRLDPAVYESMQRWAADDLRSLNAQIEFVLRRALQRESRLKAGGAPPGGAGGAGSPPPAEGSESA